MSAVLKQLEASQSFLTQVRALQNYNQLQQRQFVVLKSLVAKTSSVTAAEATRIYDAMDREIWTEEQLQELLSAVAALPPGDKAGKKLQDFSAFPNFLTQTQWTELEGCETTDQAAVKVLRYLANLGLRHPSEPTLGNVSIFSYLVLSMEVPPAETFQTEIESFKPAARRLLLAYGEPSFHLQELPEQAGALPLQVARAVYVTEGPVCGKVSLQQLLFAAGKKPLRKSSSQIRKPNALGTLVDALMQVQQGSNLSSQSSSSGARRPLALQLPPAEPTVQPAKQPLAILDREPEAAKVAAGTAEMETAEDHLQRLKQAFEEPEVSLEQRGQKRASEAAAADPASETEEKPMRRPAAAAKQAAETEEKPKKRPAAAAKQAAETEEEPKKRPAAAAQQASEAEEVPMRRPAAAPKPRPAARNQAAEDQADMERPVSAAKATAKGKAALRRPAAAGAAGPAGRQAVLGWTWEQRLAARPHGCGKCRHLVGCTPSCFA